MWGLARRRSRIREAVKRGLWQLRGRFLVCYEHREDGESRLKCVEGSRIVHHDSWAIYLDDDTAIPYHRIIEIRGLDGRLLWSRSGGEWRRE